jgi:hypothetical protein
MCLPDTIEASSKVILLAKPLRHWYDASAYVMV